MSTFEKLVVGIGLVVSLFFGIAHTNTVAPTKVGGNFNPVVVDFMQGISVNSALVISNKGAYIGPFGGNVTSIATTSTSYTLATTDFDLENSLDVTPGGASLTLAFPASSTLTSFLPVAGQTRTIFVRNATTTAGINITLTGGAGVFVKSASTTAIIQSSAASSTGARIDFVRRPNSDISALVTTYNN